MVYGCAKLHRSVVGIDNVSMPSPGPHSNHLRPNRHCLTLWGLGCRLRLFPDQARGLSGPENTMELRVCEWARKHKSRHQKSGAIYRQLV